MCRSADTDFVRRAWRVSTEGQAAGLVVAVGGMPGYEKSKEKGNVDGALVETGEVGEEISSNHLSLRVRY